MTVGTVSKPGRYLLRAHYNPYWHLSGRGCVSKGPARMTWLELPRAGSFTLSVPGSPERLVDELLGHHGC